MCLRKLASEVGARSVVWRVKGSIHHAEELGLSRMGPKRPNLQMDKVQIISDRRAVTTIAAATCPEIQITASVHTSQLPTFLSLLPTQDQSHKMPRFQLPASTSLRQQAPVRAHLKSLKSVPAPYSALSFCSK